MTGAKFWDRDPVATPDVAAEVAPGGRAGHFWLTDPPAETVNEWREVGARMPKGTRALLSTIQGPTFGFGDEIVGGLGAVASRFGGPGSDMPIGQAYRAMRDIARGAQESFGKEHPVASTGAQIVASLPYAGPVKMVQGMLPAGAGPITRAVVGGTAAGALAGAGDAQETSNILTDTLRGALFGGATGGAVQGVQTGANAMYRAIAPRFNSVTAGDVARRRVAEVLARDDVSTGQVQARLGKLGEDARIADAGGQSTRGLLDTMATLPGTAQTKVENMIHQRQAARAGVLTDAASEALGADGRRLGTTLEGLDSLRRQQAAPLYQRLQGVTVPVDNDLATILRRAAPAFAEAKRIARVEGKPFELEGAAGEVVDTLTNARSLRSISLEQLDTLKRSLYDMEQAAINPETGRLTQFGNAVKDLRRTLIDKLDSATVDPQSGQSLYAAARAAYAGPSELRAAANLGNQAMAKDAWKIGELTRDLSPSELEAFKIGAFESLRKKLGTEAGQTQVLKMWKEPATREKLQELFGNERSFREFASTVAGEARLKALESVGRGSQTARREAAIDDLNGSTMADLAGAAAGVKAGNPVSVMERVRNVYGRVATPEPVRNEIARILLAGRDAAPAELGMIQRLTDEGLRTRRNQAANSAVVGNALSRMLQPQP